MSRDLINSNNDNESQSRELSASSSALATAEVQAAITVALQFPRHEEDARGRLLRSCDRPRFAEKARYRFPRGGADIIGPSVHMAREAARCWRNVRYGFYVVWEDDSTCHVRGWAWDMEANLKVEQDARFGKKIYRKGKGWIVPDERDLRELVNKHGAIAERNCVLKVLPPELIEEALDKALASETRQIGDKLDESRKKVVAAFASLRVNASDLETYLGHPIHESTADEIADLRSIYSSIRDGNSRWSEYVAKETDGDNKKKDVSDGTIDDLLGGQAVEEDRRDKGETVPTKDDLADVEDFVYLLIEERGPTSSVDIGEVCVERYGDAIPPSWLFMAIQSLLAKGTIAPTPDATALAIVPKTEDDVAKDVDEIDAEDARTSKEAAEGLGPEDLQDDRVLPEIPFGDPKVDPFLKSIREASLIKEVDAIVSQASSDDSLSDSAFDTISTRADVRRNEIREAKKGGAS